MSPARTKYKSREDRAVVRDLLMQDWDPIGVRNLPEHNPYEYDNYVGQVYAMLIEENATAEEIGDYLWKTATGHIGVAPDDDLSERCKRTAQRLIELRPQFQTN